MDDNKRKALASALSQIEKQFGKGAVMRMGDKTDETIDVVSTGSLGLDVALGVGGLPRGRDRRSQRQLVRILRTPSSAAATVWRRTASRSPWKWNSSACA